MADLQSKLNEAQERFRYTSKRSAIIASGRILSTELSPIVNSLRQIIALLHGVISEMAFVTQDPVSEIA